MSTTNPQIWRPHPISLSHKRLRKKCFLISKKWLLTRLFDLRNSKIRSINSTEWVYGKVHQSYLIINWVRELLIHIVYESHEQPTLNPVFSNPTFIDLENSSVWKKKERGMEPSCYTTTSYKLSYP